MSFRKITRTLSMGRKKKYNECGETASAEDLKEGFGKKYIFLYATQDDQPLFDGQNVNFSTCFLELSITGIQIIDNDEQVLRTFAIEKIKDYGCKEGLSATVPIFTFEYNHQGIHTTYTFTTPQALAITATLKESIDLALDQRQGKF